MPDSFDNTREIGGAGRRPLPGSHRKPLPGAFPIGAVDPHERFRVTVMVRRRTPESRLEAHVRRLGRQPVDERRHLRRSEFRSLYAADRADLALVERFARRYGLRVVDSDAIRRRVVLEGTAGDLAAAFGVSLLRYHHPRAGTYRGRTGPVFVPDALAPVVTGVFGLDNRPQARHHGRSALRPAAEQDIYTPVEVAEMYHFPTTLDGGGQCVALVELGGGFLTDDITTYFQNLGVPAPRLAEVPVDGASNDPSNKAATFEVMLDVEVAGGIAPGATLAVYFAPNTDQGFLDALSTAIHDTENDPSVVSISWGSPENAYTDQFIANFGQLCQDAAVLGITVIAASGDDGSRDDATDDLAHVDYPASDPYVLGCGGTEIDRTTGTPVEVVWNEGEKQAGGGGVSDVFDPPAWQADANVPLSVNPGARAGRGVPDVAGLAWLWSVRSSGQDQAGFGTSAVAPLWAGLIALVNQQLQRQVGYLNPAFYGLAGTDAFHDITTGTNAVGTTQGYDVAAGWDACTGLGTPDGTALLAGLTQSAPPPLVSTTGAARPWRGRRPRRGR